MQRVKQGTEAWSGLDRRALSLLLPLCEQGANPEALAAVARANRPPPPEGCVASVVWVAVLLPLDRPNPRVLLPLPAAGSGSDPGVPEGPRVRRLTKWLSGQHFPLILMGWLLSQRTH